MLEFGEVLSNADKFNEIGIYQYGIINTKDIPFLEEIRKICEDNTCRNYASTWACPPAVGTFDECRQRCMDYDKALVFSGKYFLKNSFDIRGMRSAHAEFKNVCDRLAELIKNDIKEFLLLSNESCMRCEKCTYPASPCRFPDKLYPSLEGFGIYASKLANIASIDYNNGENTVTYFGALLFV